MDEVKGLVQVLSSTNYCEYLYKIAQNTNVCSYFSDN